MHLSGSSGQQQLMWSSSSLKGRTVVATIVYLTLLLSIRNKISCGVRYRDLLYCTTTVLKMLHCCQQTGPKRQNQK